MNYFVTAIGTDSGKTLVSAILTEALKADYWKPIQAGLPTDSDTVRSLITNSKTKVLKEKFLLKTPASPHMAAAIDGIHIGLEDLKLPNYESENLVIEGAGGLLVPINDKEYVIDIAAKFNCEIILVCDLYLGSINHSLLSIHELQRRGMTIHGIIFNGPSNPDSERVILNVAKVPQLLHIDKAPIVDSKLVKEYAQELKNNL